MSNKPIYYFTADGSGNKTGKSFSDAKPFSAIGTPELSANFEGRFYRFIWEDKRTSYTPVRNGITSLSAVTLVGGYDTTPIKDKDTGDEHYVINNNIYINPYSYTTLIGNIYGFALYKGEGDNKKIFDSEKEEPTYNEYIACCPINKHKFEFLGDCKISNIRFENQCGLTPEEPVVSVKNSNNDFTLVRFAKLISDRYTVDFANSNNTKLLSCCIVYSAVDTSPTWNGKYWYGASNYRGVISAGMNVLTSDLKPYEYCIGNTYNRGINKPLTKEDSNDPYNFVSDWYNNDGDIYNFENFGLNLWNTNGVAYASRNHVFLGAYCGVKYRNTKDSKFPISECKDSYFQDWSGYWDRSTYNVYFRNIGWGEHYEEGKYVGTTAVDVFSGGFTAGSGNTPNYIPYKPGYDKRIFDVNYTQMSIVSSTIQNVNKPLNKYSYLMYDNARPYTDVYKLADVDGFKNNINNTYKFIGKLIINGKSVYYTYNVLGTGERWDYADIKPYVDTNPDNYKDIDPFYDRNKYKEKYEKGILYEGMVGFIKNHPECVVGGVECNVDAFNRVQIQYRNFYLDNNSPYNYDKHGNLNLDIAPRALKLRGGLYDSRNYNNRKDGFANAFKVPSSTWWTWDGSHGTPFATAGQLLPFAATSLIQYELNPYYAYIKNNNYTTNNITIPDRLIYDGEFNVGVVKCNKTTSHNYSVVTLGRGQHYNSSISVYEYAKNAFVFDNNQLITIGNARTNYKDNVAVFWPAVITTSTYKKYHLVPIYGRDSDKSPSTTGKTSSRYYCNNVEGWFSYNPIEVGWAFIINNPQVNNITFGEISSFTLIDSTYIPSTSNDMVTMFECATLDDNNKLLYNTIHNTVFIKDTVPTTSKSFKVRLSNLDLTKYTIVTLKNTSFLTSINAVIIKDGKYYNMTSDAGGGFTNPSYAHNANIYERIILHPYLQNINVDMYDENSKTFTPTTRIGVWGTNNTTLTNNILNIINDSQSKYTATLEIACETENGKADFETNLVSALSCYDLMINNVKVNF